MEKTIIYSVVDKGMGMPNDQLAEKLHAMAGVTQVSASTTEGRVSVTGPNLNAKVFSQAIEQSGYEVLFISE